MGKRSKKSEKQLQQMLDEAADLVQPNSLWRHYKGGIFKVTFISFDDDTLGFVVVYEPVNHPEIHFAKGLTQWLEEVELEGVSRARFELIANA